MEWFDLFYLINVACVVISWRIAMRDFNDGYKMPGYFNLFASALNAAIVANHFI